MVRILLRAFMRPGSQAYARDNGTYGIATLRPSHVRVRGDCVEFSYPGKGGKKQLRRIEDRENQCEQSRLFSMALPVACNN